MNQRKSPGVLGQVAIDAVELVKMRAEIADLKAAKAALLAACEAIVAYVDSDYQEDVGTAIIRQVRRTVAAVKDETHGSTGGTS